MLIVKQLTVDLLKNLLLLLDSIPLLPGTDGTFCIHNMYILHCYKMQHDKFACQRTEVRMIIRLTDVNDTKRIKMNTLFSFV